MSDPDHEPPTDTSGTSDPSDVVEPGASAAPAPTDPAVIEARVRAVVATLDVDGVEVVDCDPALADTAEFCAAYGYELADSANAIVVVGKSTPPAYAVAMVLATHRLDVNGLVRRRLGTRKASFAPAADIVALTGMEIGGVTPLALPPNVPVWIDAAVMARSRIVIGGGSRSCKVVGPPRLLTAAVASAEVVDGLAQPHPSR